MEMTDFNCNKEGDYTVEKLFNFWGIVPFGIESLK